MRNGRVCAVLFPQFGGCVRTKIEEIAMIAQCEILSCTFHSVKVLEQNRVKRSSVTHRYRFLTALDDPEEQSQEKN